MPIYRCFYQIAPQAFIPFNDAPTYISGSVRSGERDEVVLSGEFRRQDQGWYNIGGRTAPLQPESFAFSANAVATEKLGAYSLGVVGQNGVSLNVSHFLRNAQALHSNMIGTNFYSGFGHDASGHRTQIGIPAPFEPTERLHSLSVVYARDARVLECTANGLPLHRVHGELGPFRLELRLEGVGVEGPFHVRFEQLYYYPLDGDTSPNLRVLSAWDPQYAPVFVSYSHQDRESVMNLVDILKNRGVRVLGDWDFKAGDSLIRRIGECISRSGYLVVVLSTRSVKSSWVQKELDIAMNSEISGQVRKVQVLPIIIENCTIPLFLTGKLYIDLRESAGAEIEKLMATLRAFGQW
jgi:hypothetical protein